MRFDLECNLTYRVLFLHFCFTGVGTRNYYRKIGYRLQGPYMVKTLK